MKCICYVGECLTQNTFCMSTCYYYYYLRGVEGWVATLETKEQSEEVIRANVNYLSVVGEKDDEIHKEI